MKLPKRTSDPRPTVGVGAYRPNTGLSRCRGCRGPGAVSRGVLLEQKCPGSAPTPRGRAKESPLTEPESIATHRQLWMEADIEYGLCLCGCGEETTLAPRNRPSQFEFRGEPYRYRPGHHGRKPGAFSWIEEERGYATPCWIWQGPVYGSGYGAASKELAHRWAYERARGPIPQGLTIDHLCCVPLCVNPDHLEVVTMAENCRRRPTNKLTADDVATMRRLGEEGNAQTTLAKRFGVTQSHVSRILSNDVWKDS